MTTEKISYGTSTAITCTLASLASSATAGRGCAAVDNTSDLFDDALLYIAVKTSSSALANDKACYVYIYGSEDGTNYNGSSAEAEGTNAAVTIDSPTNLRGPYIIACPSTSTTYKGVFSIASCFGGIMPRKWGFVLRNYTGQNLDSTEGNHTKSYTGIYYTST
jgi:hypothetical protein